MKLKFKKDIMVGPAFNPLEKASNIVNQYNGVPSFAAGPSFRNCVDEEKAPNPITVGGIKPCKRTRVLRRPPPRPPDGDPTWAAQRQAMQAEIAALRAWTARRARHRAQPHALDAGPPSQCSSDVVKGPPTAAANLKRIITQYHADKTCPLQQAAAARQTEIERQHVIKEIIEQGEQDKQNLRRKIDNLRYLYDQKLSRQLKELKRKGLRTKTGRQQRRAAQTIQKIVRGNEGRRTAKKKTKKESTRTRRNTHPSS